MELLRKIRKNRKRVRINKKNLITNREINDNDLRLKLSIFLFIVIFILKIKKDGE